MDHELKQRLIGAVVVTALCAIFIPMLFDDPVDNSGQLVSELSIPAPADSGTANKQLPTGADQVLKPIEEEPLSTDTVATEEMAEPEASQLKPERSAGEPLYAESAGYDDSGEGDFAEPAPALPAKKPVVQAVVPKTKPKAAEPLAPAVKKPPQPAKEAEAVKPPAAAKKIIEAIAEPKKPAVEAKAPAKLERWYIQLGSFSKKENAMSLWNSLHDQGLPVSLDTVKTDKGATYRLRIGPELDKKKAAAMKSRLDKQNIDAILLAE
ncbi:MAG: SPOR domain-containing protein [Methylobacter sp.]|nr:SPOR domain-containing protein [Methylobacter sp.]